MPRTLTRPYAVSDETVYIEEGGPALKRVREIVEESERQVRDFFHDLDGTRTGSDSLRVRPRALGEEEA